MSAVNQLLVCKNIFLNTDVPASSDPTESITCSSSADCSGHGTCIEGRCLCFTGYFLSDCSLSQAITDLQNQYRQQLLDKVMSTISTNGFDMNSITSMAYLLDTSIQVPTLNYNETLDAALDGVNQMIQLMNASLGSTLLNYASAIQATANTISDALNTIIQQDCGLWNNFSIRALNRSFDLLQDLSMVSLMNEGPISSYPQTNITTKLYSMISGVYDRSQLNNLELYADDESPEIQLGTLRNEEDLPMLIALNYIYLKRDPLTCSETPPPTNFTLQFYDASDWQPVSPNTSVTVTYPKQSFGKVVCSEDCIQKPENARGDSVCTCNDISIFDVGRQLSRLYEQSNLKLLTLSNIADIFTSPIYLEWAFWVAVAFLLWLIITLVIVNTCNKNYCLVKYLKRSGSLNSCTTFFIFLAVMHPFFNIYFYRNDRTSSKSFRALFYFVRNMALLGTSAIFMKNTVNHVLHYLLLITTI